MMTSQESGSSHSATENYSGHCLMVIESEAEQQDNAEFQVKIISRCMAQKTEIDLHTW